MAVLSSWQKINRVLSGLPFGDGKDGALTVSGDTTQSIANASCSGLITSTDLTLGAASTFADGDVILLHQSRGTGVGQWEINRITSGGGGTAIVLTKALQYTYTDSGASQAQAYTIPRYTTVTVNNGITWSAPEWDGNVGGILLFAAKTSATITGNILTSSKGFLKGAVAPGAGQFGYQGEGSAGAGAQAHAANGNGGGSGCKEGGDAASGGGGGGNGAAATDGGDGEAGAGHGGDKGTAAGAADATTITFGGGGGSPGWGSREATPGQGADGAGLLFAFCKDFTVTGTCVNTGGNGTNGTAGDASYLAGGGGGGGGSFVLCCQTATLGTNLITAAAGTGGAGSAVGGAGGAGAVGRIAVHHSKTVTGTTNPTFTDTTDASIVESTGFLAFL